MKKIFLTSPVGGGSSQPTRINSSHLVRKYLRVLLLKYKKNRQLAIFLIDCGYGQTFTTNRTTTIQNIASRFCCHLFTKAVCFYATCFRWLISSFSCHIKSFWCIYLSIYFFKTQHFYLLFTKPSFFRPSKNK